MVELVIDKMLRFLELVPRLYKNQVWFCFISTVDLSGKVKLNDLFLNFKFPIRCCMAHKPTDNSTVDISGKVTIIFFFFLNVSTFP